MLNDARVASLGFFKDNICTTRIHKEKKFKIKFQVLLKFAQIIIDERRSNIVRTEFTIAICRTTGDKWQSKKLFQSNFDPRSSIVKSIFDCRLSGVVLLNIGLQIRVLN